MKKPICEETQNSSGRDWRCERRKGHKGNHKAMWGGELMIVWDGKGRVFFMGPNH